MIGDTVLKNAASLRPLGVADRAKRLLEYFVLYSRSPGTELVILPATQEYGPGALAWSESTTPDELKFFRDYLIEKGWIRRTGQPTRPTSGVVVTVQGHEALARPPDSQSNDAFVAMWLEPISKIRDW